MDKIFSARLDESVLSELERFTQAHHMTKKRFLEEAIQAKVQGLKGKEGEDVWAQSCGVWKRRESAAALVKQIRGSMRKSYRRYQSS